MSGLWRSLGTPSSLCSGPPALSACRWWAGSARRPSGSQNVSVEHPLEAKVGPAQGDVVDNFAEEQRVPQQDRRDDRRDDIRAIILARFLQYHSWANAVGFISVPFPPLPPHEPRLRHRPILFVTDGALAVTIVTQFQFQASPVFFRLSVDDEWTNLALLESGHLPGTC